jgi:hypothetical protein
MLSVVGCELSVAGCGHTILRIYTYELSAISYELAQQCPKVSRRSIKSKSGESVFFYLSSFRDAMRYALCALPFHPAQLAYSK